MNIYEVQAILYWILGELILHLGSWHWLGWISICYGWFTFVYCFFYASRHLKELKEFGSSTSEPEKTS